MLSIIIITKNEEKCLPRLLNSLKNQSFQDFEIIVSDAQSTDRTREIAQLYGCKVVEGGLPSVGRNNGARVARGDILLFLDADVVLPRDFLRLSLIEFSRRRLYCAAPFLKPISKSYFDKTLHNSFNLWVFIVQYFRPFAGGCCIFCKKKLFDYVKGFDEKILMAEDHAFIKKCKKYAKFRILRKKPVYVDVRRLNKEGRLKIATKFFYQGASIFISGDKQRPPFDYELNGGVKIKKR